MKKFLLGASVALILLPVAFFASPIPRSTNCTTECANPCWAEYDQKRDEDRVAAWYGLCTCLSECGCDVTQPGNLCSGSSRR